MTDAFVLYPNPRCSKSRAALALLAERGIEPRIVRYLDTPPDVATLHALLTMLGLTPRAVLRTGEEAFRTLGLASPDLDDRALVDAMAAHPELIERPILVRGNRAVIGRPTERLLTLLD